MMLTREPSQFTFGLGANSYREMIMRLLLVFTSLMSFSNNVFAGVVAPTPGPLLGVIAGPWGLVAGGTAYLAYRALRAKR